jgi:hypothetical protein
MEDMEAVVVKAGPTTYIETSATNELMIELDARGQVLRLQIEPEAWVAWPAEVLADRIKCLHHLALMRARAESRAAMNDERADLASARAWPTAIEIDEFRRSINF